MSELADRLCDAMLRRNISGYTLAKRASVSRTYIHEILHGDTKRPGWEKISALAGALGVDPHWLLTGEARTEDSRDAEIARLRAENAALREQIRKARLALEPGDE